MKSAVECFQNAAKCEEMAKDAPDNGQRAMLLAAAGHWRTLGKLAKAAAAEAAKAP